MGIGKKDLFENYYLDEFLLLMRRQVKANKRREKIMNQQPKEKTEVVGWDQFGI